MRMKPIRDTGISITEISVGSWAVGDGYFGKVETADTIDALRRSMDLGINHIDTASLYGNGLSEELVGQAVKGVRKDVIISTKVWTTHFKRDDLIRSAEDSLRRLGTDYVDVLFLHYFQPAVPLEETMDALRLLREQGKIRAVGVSNFSSERIRAADAMTRVDVAQPCYSLLWRGIEKDVVQTCVENNIAIVAYSPLAQGLLTGKFTKETQLDDGRAKAPLFNEPYYSECLEIAEGLKPFAQKYDCTPAQIAIRWVCQSRGLTSAIVGAKNSRQAEENAKAASFELTNQDFAAISALSDDFSAKLPTFVNFFTNKIAE